LAVLLAALSCALPARIEAQQIAGESDRGFPATSLFVFDIDGSFRSRTEVWHDMDLGLAPQVNRYGVYPMLSEGDGASIRETTDMRLRFSPVLRVAQRADVHAVIDLFNAVGGEGGSTTVGGAGNSREAFFDAYGIPAAGSLGSPLNSAAVRMAWVDLMMWHIAVFQVGRVPAHWGMGLVENDGSGVDADGGDAVDGITALVTLWKGFDVSLSLDWPLEGRAMYDPFAPWGHGYDLGDLDDIWQWRIKVLMRGAEAPDGSSFSWGLFTRFRWQNYSSLGDESPAEGCRSPYPWFPEYSCVELLARDAFVFTPDVWMKAVFNVGGGFHLDVEGEVAARLGWLDATQELSGNASDKNLLGIGGALKTQIRTDDMVAGIEIGIASGDEGSLAFGVLDRPTVAEPDEANWQNSPVSHNDTVTSFLFHPNYFVDRIMFRRVVGAVTNSFYAKPNAQIELWELAQASLWLDASLLYGRALVPSSTPGNAQDLGLEADVGLVLKVGDHVQTRLDGAALLPGDAFARASKEDSQFPWAGRLLLDLSF